MAKKKAAEIAELQSRLRTQADLYKEAEPLLPIAEALRDAVNARLMGESAGALIDVDGAFDAALAEVAETLIATKLHALDPEIVLRLYADHVGDDVLREQLGRWATAKAEELDRERQREALRKASARSGRVALEDLDEGVRVEIGMFEPLHRSRARRESSIPPSRTIGLRLLEPSAGRAEVISDVSLARGAEETLTPHARGTFGSLIVDGERRWLDPCLQLHAPLGYEFGQGPVNSAEVIGFVEIENGLVILG